ncbi:hypothetical protein D6D15_09151 [Aureobasidium pullulans]|uniref:SRR1-like domain-containing protein n=1 Tax=Aureobasidium pullulans TaxID=5580 RepID=A0A4S9AV67_AURPU|nr:hypothetical protein D6D15_09151 [Aureobasidium pullulans]
MLAPALCGSCCFLEVINLGVIRPHPDTSRNAFEPDFTRQREDKDHRTGSLDVLNCWRRRLLPNDKMAIPPHRPSNPFPKSTHESLYSADISEDIFDGCLQNFHYSRPGFDSQDWTEESENSEPMDGYLRDVGLKVVDAVKQILDAGPELWYNVPRLRKLLVGTKAINNAVCLGLGGGFIQLQEQGDEETFIWQYALFDVFCQIIERKQKMESGSLPRYFQDPAFEIEEEHILQNVLGEKVIQHPEATELIDEHSFVFGIHIPWSSLANIFFTGRPHPQIFIGNSIEIGMSGIACAVADKYIRQVYLDHETTPGEDIIELRRQAELFVNSHSCTYLSEGVDEDADDQHFGSTYVYGRKRPQS